LIEGSKLCTLVERKVSNGMRRIEWPVRAASRQGAACGAENLPPTALCLFRSSFWSFLELKRRPYMSLRRETLLYMECLCPVFGSACSLPQQGLCAAFAATGPGLVLIFLKFDSFITAVKSFLEMRLQIP
jgi:hypothetical protein